VCVGRESPNRAVLRQGKMIALVMTKGVKLGMVGGQDTLRRNAAMHAKFSK